MPDLNEVAKNVGGHKYFIVRRVTDGTPDPYVVITVFIRGLVKQMGGWWYADENGDGIVSIDTTLYETRKEGEAALAEESKHD